MLARSRTAETSPWRWFPAATIAAMLVVVFVNAGMIAAALRSFPGSAGEDGFDLSNGYDKILVGSARQNRLGWSVEVSAAGGAIALRAVGRDGIPIAADGIAATAERPVGPPHTTRLTWQPGPDHTWRAHENLPAGQWLVMSTVRARGVILTATQHLIVP